MPGLIDDDRVRDLLGQPAGVRHRREHVVLAVPEQHRDLDVGQIEPPRRAEGERVVDPAVGGVAQRLGVVLREQGADARRRLTTRRSASGISGRNVMTWLAGLALIRAAVCTRLCGQQLGSCVAAVYSRTLESGHPGEPVQTLGVPRAPALTSTPARVTRSGSRAAQASACGPPPDRPSTANRSTSSASAIVATSGDHVGHPPAVQSVRAAVAGPVEADQPDPELVEHPALRERPNTASGSSVQHEHRMTGGVTGHLQGEVCRGRSPDG